MTVAVSVQFGAVSPVPHKYVPKVLRAAPAAIPLFPVIVRKEAVAPAAKVKASGVAFGPIVGVIKAFVYCPKASATTYLTGVEATP